jgi:hypothetical protein
MLRMVPWYRWFGLLLEDFFTGTAYGVRLEEELSLKRQFLDVLILRWGGWPGAEVAARRSRGAGRAQPRHLQVLGRIPGLVGAGRVVRALRQLPQATPGAER